MIDVLVSTVLLSICISALMSLWVFCLTRVQQSRELTLAGQIARAEVEQAKVYGFPNLPKGGYRADRGDSLWTGTYNRRGNEGRGGWSQSNEAYYDVNGLPCDGTNANAMFITTSELRDTDIAVNEEETDYDLALTSRRTLIVTVAKLSSRKPILKMSTDFVKGGL